MVKIDNKTLQHDLQLSNGELINLSEWIKDKVVLYFYPRANTPGCSTESQDFGVLYDQFKKSGCEVLGVSMDSVKKQHNFKQKFEMPFELVADIEEVLCLEFDVVKEKKMYGKTFMGIERSTFVINASGEILLEWRKVKVAGHANEVLLAVRDLN